MLGELLLEEWFLVLSIVVVERLAVLVVFALSEMCAASFWWRSRIVDVACWRPADVAFDGCALTQFFGLVKDVFPSNILSGQLLVLLLIVEVSCLLESFSDFCQKLENWVCALMVSFSTCLNEQSSQSNMLFSLSHACLWMMATMSDCANLIILKMFAPG